MHQGSDSQIHAFIHQECHTALHTHIYIRTLFYESCKFNEIHSECNQQHLKSYKLSISKPKKASLTRWRYTINDTRCDQRLNQHFALAIAWKPCYWTRECSEFPLRFNACQIKILYIMHCKHMCSEPITYQLHVACNKKSSKSQTEDGEIVLCRQHNP